MATRLVRIPDVPKPIRALVGNKANRGDWPDIDLTISRRIVALA